MSAVEVEDAERPITYALGHSEQEFRRLMAQARLLEPITRRFFRDAGITPGMRVLDVGSGAGDVGFLVSDLVGTAGEVIGTDTASVAIAVASARANERSLRNISFREGNPAEMRFDRPFDAIVGRYVLQFCTDPVTTVKSLAGHLRPGGLMVFHELDWDGARSFPPAPIYDQCCQWFVDTFRLLATETRMGIKLYSSFVGAGLPGPTMRLDAIIAAGSEASPWLYALADLLGTMLPQIERLGVATAAEVDIATLAERLCRENTAVGGVVVGRSEICAWSRL